MEFVHIIQQVETCTTDREFIKSLVSKVLEGRPAVGGLGRPSGGAVEPLCPRRRELACRAERDTLRSRSTGMSVAAPTFLAKVGATVDVIVFRRWRRCCVATCVAARICNAVRAKPAESQLQYAEKRLDFLPRRFAERRHHRRRINNGTLQPPGLAPLLLKHAFIHM